MARPALTDHLGQPIDFAALRRQRPGPSVSGVRSVLTGHPADGLDPRRLASILRAAEQGSPQPYLELAEQIEERYPHYLSVLGTRKSAVSQLDITIEAFSDDTRDEEIADFVRDWFQRPELEEELFDILDAVGKGFSATRINWDTSEGQWLPSSLEWWDPRWIEFDQVDGRTPLLRDEISGVLAPFAPYEFIWHEHKAKSGLPIRGGLARPAAWLYLFQSFGLKDWVAFAEVYGLPLRLGRYDNGETDDNIRLLMRAVAGVSSDAAAVLPKSMEMEFVDGKQANSDGGLYEKLNGYCDRTTSKLVVGQTATTDAEIGGLGSGKEHGDVRTDIRDSDARRLAATLKRALVRPIVDFNFGAQVGKGRGYPNVAIGRAESWDPVTMMPAVKTFVELGGKVGITTIGDKLGLPEPKGDEELLTAPKLTAPVVPPQEGAPGTPGAGAPPATPAQPANDASQALLKPLKAALALAARSVAADRDPIDRFVAEELSGWEAVIDPIIAPIEATLAACSTLEEARDRLASSIAGMDPSALAQLLGRAGFAARLAGMADDGVNP